MNAQNIVFSIAILAAMIPLAVFSIIGVAVTVLMHEASELLAVANGLRAGRFFSYWPKQRHPHFALSRYPLLICSSTKLSMSVLICTHNGKWSDIWNVNFSLSFSFKSGNSGAMPPV